MTQSWQMVLTWGLGVGLGTARASSFAVALLASVGIPGALFYTVFVFECFLRARGRPGSLEADIAAAARNGYAGLLIGDLLVGPIIDQGFFFCMLAGLAAAIRPRTANAPKLFPLAAGART